MYSVYFDNILQAEKDIINITDVMETSIVRQDGFDSQAQILREKSDATLEFTGDAYKYVCNILKEDACHVFNVRIEETCGYIYNATMSIIGIERNLHTCIAKTDLKDNSFSAYIDGYIDTEVPLYNTKTKNCETIGTVLKQIVMPYDVTNPTLTHTINTFDVLDVFKYLINFYTDSRFTVVSDYLTENKYAITTGFNMHNFGLSLEQIYPSLSFTDLFIELRKKLRLYMGIEYDDFGNPYLRIEQEDYFFAEVELFSIDELPKNAIQTYDNKRNFNEISIGSSTTKVQEDSPITYNQERFVAWNNEPYGGCGTCIGEKESKLDLVSDYIIDSNVIIEALIADVSLEHANDDSIFLFNYTNISGIDTGVFTLDIVTGFYYYNDTLRNENVLANYIDYYQRCIEIQRSSLYGFKMIENQYTISRSTFLFGGCKQDHILFSNKIYDNKASISTGSIIGFTDACGNPPVTDTFSQFVCQAVGMFNFQAKIVNMKGVNASSQIAQVDYTLHILVYNDNTYTTIINDYNTTVTQIGEINVNLTLETGEIPLAIGNEVVVFFEFSVPTGIGVINPTYTAEYASFELLSDNFSCESADNTEDSKPYILRFDHPICFEDYNKANNNKRGYINVKGTKQYIKELKYIDKKLSNFTLLSNDFITYC